MVTEMGRWREKKVDSMRSTPSSSFPFESNPCKLGTFGRPANWSTASTAACLLLAGCLFRRQLAAQQCLVQNFLRRRPVGP